MAARISKDAPPAAMRMLSPSHRQLAALAGGASETCGQRMGRIAANTRQPRRVDSPGDCLRGMDGKSRCPAWSDEQHRDRSAATRSGILSFCTATGADHAMPTSSVNSTCRDLLRNAPRWSKPHVSYGQVQRRRPPDVHASKP